MNKHEYLKLKYIIKKDYSQKIKLQKLKVIYSNSLKKQKRKPMDLSKEEALIIDAAKKITGGDPFDIARSKENVFCRDLIIWGLWKKHKYSDMKSCNRVNVSRSVCPRRKIESLIDGEGMKWEDKEKINAIEKFKSAIGLLPTI